MRLLARIIAAACVAALAACGQSADGVSSALIINAQVIDGTGTPRLQAAVRIDGDKITAIGRLKPLPGETIIDAAGLILAPGFIDPHSHADGDLKNYRHMPGVLSQGITTIARGLDGSYSNDDDFTFQQISEFNAAFNARPAAVNIASFAAHGTIRSAVMGRDYRREATPDEIKAMQALVAADMKAGALGLASGLEYEPGIYSTTAEMIELARTAAAYGGIYSSHMRDEDDRMLEAVDEVLEIAKHADIRAIISHIKLADIEFWGTANSLIAKLNTAHEAGIDVRADIYPYLRWQANLSVLFPQRDYTDARVAEYTFKHSGTPDDILLVEFLPNPAFNNMTLAQIARVTERDPVELLLSLSAAADEYRNEHGRDGSSIIVTGMDEADVINLMQWPLTMICSDGSHDSGHPRGHGSFPRVLGHFVRELDAFSLETAVHKMTGLTADSLRLPGRGRIEAGAYADLVLFDPELVNDTATMAEPTSKSTGIEKVWVNGVLAFDKGEPTMMYAGRIVTL